jgi:hypothetical protein
MKIELIKETNNGSEWYEIRFDGKYITGSSSYEVAEQKYNEYLSFPSSIGKRVEVLKSDVIDLSLHSNQTI